MRFFDTPGIAIPGYEIKKQIGQGGMARVYLAIQETLGRPVALKVMAPNLAGETSIQERFLKEGRTIAQFRHPNIITIYDIGHVESVHYMVMEYIEGGSLKDRLQQHRAIDNPVDVIKQVASALSYAHKRGFVHRDVKPGNILLRENEEQDVVLSDFGIVKRVDSTTTLLTETGAFVGTLDYVSPEQATATTDIIDGRSDLYSLGIVFYEVLTGGNPFGSHDSNPLAAVLARLNVPATPRLPEEFRCYQPIIDRLLAKERDYRFRDADQLLEALERVGTSPDGRFRVDNTIPLERSQLPVPESQPEHKQPDVRPPKPKWKWVAAVSLLLVVLGGGWTAVEFFQRPIKSPSAVQDDGELLSSQNEVKEQPDNDVQQEKIDDLLAEAKNQFEEKRLILPTGDNAVQTYRAVLDLDAGNVQARTRLKQILGEYKDRAQAMQQAGNLQQSLQIIEEALTAWPKDDELLVLQTEVRAQVDSQLQEQQIRAQVENLLAQAEQQLKQMHLTTPEGNSAYDSYQEILQLSANDKRAINGIARIVDRYIGLATKGKNEKEYVNSLEYISKGLDLINKHDLPRNKSDLINLKEEIESIQEEKLADGPVTPPEDEVSDSGSDTLSKTMSEPENLATYTVETDESWRQIENSLSHLNTKADSLLKEAEGKMALYDSKARQSPNTRGMKTETCYGNCDNAQAEYMFRNGDVYIGQWRNYQMNGTGAYYALSKGQGIVYIGDWKNHQKNGKGIIYFSNGDKYYGGWKNNEKHGLGIHYFQNGDRLVSEYSNGRQVGSEAVRYFRNGDKYVGGWLPGKGKRHGEGVIYHSNGTKTVAVWNNDRVSKLLLLR